MAGASYNLIFGGYWREVHKGGIPAESGVYCVYVCRFNEEKKTVTLDDLIYIGQAEDAKEEIAQHKKWPVWRKGGQNAGAVDLFQLRASSQAGRGSGRSRLGFHDAARLQRFLEGFLSSRFNHDQLDG